MASKSDYVCLYTGSGTETICVDATYNSLVKLFGKDMQRRIIKVESPVDFASDKSLAKGNTLMMPGGKAFYMFLAFQQFQKEKEKIGAAILSDRCSYTGICAGASMAGPAVYSHELNLKEALPPVYQLTSRVTRGFFTSPTQKMSKADFEPIPKKSKTPQVESLIDLRTAKTMHMLRWGGGSFDETNLSKGEEVVALYQSEKATTLGVAAFKPRPNILLCHVHPELQISGQKIPDLSEKDQALLDASAKAVETWFKDALISIGMEDIQEAQIAAAAAAPR
jgi:glutamine amidotransferase-like uncharacterized protein